MRAEIDQSGKMGNTSVDTVLAMSNGCNFAILIPAPVKRSVLAKLKAQGISKTRAVIRMFTAGLLLLLSRHIGLLTLIIIDQEYPGYEADIKGMLLQRFKERSIYFEPDSIVFRRIGKRSPAHRLAISVYRGRRTPDKIVTEKELFLIAARRKKY
ncbi:MAG TPA: hypothetical protein ENG33_09520 [Chloroflexi bacterium]|nr:hypothetical protein [Chloroflexota bacterium]